ncbi:MAG: DUF1156 domain-containing protein [Dehalococcoidia bacterium]|nr:DUF1156 domain-containing protein [Dehalococcoidia bacterium]MYK27000.1 DUF1156 domain-containing protein [Dehalococcoidia bacterium]
MTYRKKLIEVALPLDAINKASAREKLNRHGHPSTLHLWWSRKPLATARAVLFAQLVEDPSSRPELFPTEDAQSVERQRLFRIIEELMKWGNTTKEQVLEGARKEIRTSWRRTCEDNRDHPQATDLFNPRKLPGFHDPFAGGGSIPLEAQRLGLEAHASDLNPVAVLINKAMIEIPPRFAGKPPVNPDSHSGQADIDTAWRGATGLSEDVRYYGKWMRDEAKKRIGHLYPKVAVTEEMALERPDLKPYVGRKLTVIAWLWARTVKSPNPAFADVDVPLASTLILSKKKGKEAYVEPVIEDSSYYFTVRVGVAPEWAKAGTRIGGRGNFRCLMSDVPVTNDYVRSEGIAGRMDARLMALVADGDRERLYLPPETHQESATAELHPEWRPTLEMPDSPRYIAPPLYGMTTFADLFTDRQLVALTTFSDLVGEARGRVLAHAVAAGLADDDIPLREGGVGARAYAEAVSVYLALTLDRLADYWTSLGGWQPANQQFGHLFTRQAIPIAWDYAEANPFSEKGGSFKNLLEWTMQSITNLGHGRAGVAFQGSASTQNTTGNNLISTDPPYFDNVGYADLSDFFYVWLRPSLGSVFPSILATLSAPKLEELVATPYRHGGKEKAEVFFLDGMSQVVQRLANETHPAFPTSIYYAFKQSEQRGSADTSSTGWETFLAAVIEAGFSVTGTWPMRTELSNRMRGMASNALASSIVLVCRPRPGDAPIATRREVVDALKAELPPALAQLQAGNIAPVDLAQAAIGPGMGVFTRYRKVLDASGEPVSVREALALINQTLEETLVEQEADFDADTRWALAWFEQSGFAEGDFGVAETLSKAKNTSVEGMVDAGILVSRAGKVRLLPPEELPEDWDPQTERRLTVWESVHHLVRVLHLGEEPASEVVARLGAMAEPARELAYRLYRICDQKNRPQEALAYNALIQSWPELATLARQRPPAHQGTLLDDAGGES